MTCPTMRAEDKRQATNGGGAIPRKGSLMESAPNGDRDAHPYAAPSRIVLGGP